MDGLRKPLKAKTYNYKHMKHLMNLTDCRTKEELVYVANEFEQEAWELLRRELMDIVEYTDSISYIRKQVKQRLLQLNN